MKAPLSSSFILYPRIMRLHSLRIDSLSECSLPASSESLTKLFMYLPSHKGVHKGLHVLTVLCIPDGI